MLNITVPNVNHALPVALMHFQQAQHNGHLIKSVIHGKTRLEWPTPFSTTYLLPEQRVLFNVHRDANPFFHLMESLWILNGRADVRWIAEYLPFVKEFSDDGYVFHGAYGERMHHHDQIGRVIKRLKADPDTTRAVLQIYAASRDSDYNGKDMPCNCTVMMTIRHGRLQLTVCNRSNDLIWGAYGANVVQFSMLQEYIANCLEIPCGSYVQFSHNTHIYPQEEATSRCVAAFEQGNISGYDDGYAYGNDTVVTHSLGADLLAWHMDLHRLLNNDMSHSIAFATPYFKFVVNPMRMAYYMYRRDKLAEAIAILNDCERYDWIVAGRDWIRRRLLRRTAGKGQA